MVGVPLLPVSEAVVHDRVGQFQEDCIVWKDKYALDASGVSCVVVVWSFSSPLVHKFIILPEYKFIDRFICTLLDLDYFRLFFYFVYDQQESSPVWKDDQIERFLFFFYVKHPLHVSQVQVLFRSQLLSNQGLRIASLE